jgi:hypothetical protein
LRAKAGIAVAEGGERRLVNMRRVHAVKETLAVRLMRSASD